MRILQRSQTLCRGIDKHGEIVKRGLGVPFSRSIYTKTGAFSMFLFWLFKLSHSVDNLRLPLLRQPQIVVYSACFSVYCLVYSVALPLRRTKNTTAPAQIAAPAIRPIHRPMLLSSPVLGVEPAVAVEITLKGTLVS